MAAIASRGTWQRQPSGLLTLDYGRSLSQGIQHWQSGADVSRFVNVNGVALAPTDRGLSQRYAIASSQYLKASLGAWTGLPLTFLVLVRQTSGATNQVYASIGNASAGGHVLYVDDSERLYLFSGNGGSTAQAQSAPNVLILNEWTTIVGRVSAVNAREVFKNGVSVASNTTSVTSFTCNTLALGAQWYAGAASGYFGGDMALAVAWNRALSDAEILEVSRNPWQLFTPLVRRVYVEVAASGPAPGAGTLTLTGFAPAVTQLLAVAPGMGMLWNTAFDPTVSLGQGATPSTGVLAITGDAPTVSLTHAMTLGSGVVTVTGLAPAVAVTSGIVPSTGAVALSGYAPTVQLTLVVTPSTGTVVLTGLAPAVQLDRVIAPSTGAVTITGVAPTATITAAGITPATGALTITGAAPAVTMRHAVSVGLGTLTLTGMTPVVTVADLSITFVRAAFSAASPSVDFTSKAPSVTFTPLGS